MTGDVLLARILRPQGRSGEILAELHTDFPETLPRREGLVLVSPAGVATPCAVERAWLPKGRSAGRVVLKLAGHDSMDAAEALRGSELRVPEDHRIKLEADTFYVSDLAGCTVFDGDLAIGTVTGVQLPTDSEGRPIPDAPAILEIVDGEGATALIPFAQAFLKSVDVLDRRIRMELPAGLVEATRSR